MLGPILPFPLEEKKLDFSPSAVRRKVPKRKIVGTATNSNVAMKPKFVVSIKGICSTKKLSPSGSIMLLYLMGFCRSRQEMTLRL